MKLEKPMWIFGGFHQCVLGYALGFIATAAKKIAIKFFQIVYNQDSDKLEPVKVRIFSNFPAYDLNFH